MTDFYLYVVLIYTRQLLSITHCARLFRFQVYFHLFILHSPFGFLLLSHVELKTFLRAIANVEMTTIIMGLKNNLSMVLFICFICFNCDSLCSLNTLLNEYFWNWNGLAFWEAGCTKCAAFVCKISTIRKVSHTETKTNNNNILHRVQSP